MSNLYGYNGAFSQSILPENYSVPDNTNYYGKQESLLNKLDNPTRINTFLGYNFPSPYQNPMTNFGVGPQAVNFTQEILSDQNKSSLFELPVLRTSTKSNPFMNVMPLDYDSPQLYSDYYKYEDNTYPSKKDLKVREEVKNNFENRLYQNADSLLWERLNSQRQFVSMPVGSVPNKQNEFASFLYGNKNVCKQGSVFVHTGVKYTDDSLLCNGFNTGEPTNNGLLDGNFSSSIYHG